MNGKIAAAFGAVNDEGAATLSGSFVTPLGHSFGLQLDGSVGSTDGNASYGIGAHAFWRDPSQALLGVYASYSGFDGERDVNLGLVAAEGEAYFGRVSLEGLVGFDYGYGDTDLFGSATVGFYPLDDLRLYGGYLNVVGRSFATLGAEWQPGLAAAPNASLFADGLVGEDDAWSVMGGVRFYLGKEHKSLIRRHREDDPGDLGLRAVSQVLDHLQVKAEEVRCPKPKVMLNGSCVYLSHN
ncbi:hypothetical protein [Breoghania sp.]|uniref:hypothetical protein n=1 Tax=Breoghania sp. TaxID=2065378 RepID=UPI002AA84BB8|nr:hypothetical protein [Breoghania sp.]